MNLVLERISQSLLMEISKKKLLDFMKKKGRKERKGEVIVMMLMKLLRMRSKKFLMRKEGKLVMMNLKLEMRKE
ncbi:unnamed protein product [Meloidogyne enterolobii]|uniref:Uncharacterized protein n=1 Tax=Meloidogyne enterolobii TaxID=390850 RepID=A0ACB0ZN92_MELEN